MPLCRLAVPPAASAALDELHVCINGHALSNRPRHRTQIRVRRSHSFDYIAHVLGNAQPIRHVNTSDDQNTAVLANLPAHVRDEIVRFDLDLTRCQRAGKSAG